MLLIDLPLFLASTCSISSFYLVAQRSFAPRPGSARFLYLPFVMATGSAFPCARASGPGSHRERKRIRAHAKIHIEGKQGTFAKKFTGTKPAGCPTRKSFSGSIFP